MLFVVCACNIVYSPGRGLYVRMRMIARTNQPIIPRLPLALFRALYSAYSAHYSALFRAPSYSAPGNLGIAEYAERSAECAECRIPRSCCLFFRNSLHRLKPAHAPEHRNKKCASCANAYARVHICTCIYIYIYTYIYTYINCACSFL